MRKAFLTVHLWAGLIAAVFLFLVGISGAIIAFENELDRFLNSGLYYVQPRGHLLGLDAISQKLLAQYPGAKIDGFEPPEKPDLALIVGLEPSSGKEMTLFVDPYTGDVRGDAQQGNRFVSRVHQFHTHLLAGEIGKQIVGWSGVFLLLLSITGIVLWWRAKVFRWPSSGTPTRFHFELHSTSGLLSSVFLFIFAITGICIHWERQVNALAAKMSPSPSGRPAQRPDAGTVPLSPDRLIEVAKSALPDARVTLLQMSSAPRQPVTVVLKFPEDHTPLGRTRMAIAPYSGRVLQIQSSRDFSPAMKYSRMWNREIHTGDIFGMPTRILAAFFSLMVPLLAVTGPLLWWNRRRAASRATRGVLSSKAEFAEGS